MNTFDNIIFFLKTFVLFLFILQILFIYFFFFAFFTFKPVAPAYAANNLRHFPANRKHSHWD